MSQYAFGAGNMYATPLQDAWGNAIANPTPIPLMVLQEGSIDMSGDVKELYGQNQFAVAVGRGKVKMSIKVKPARIFAAAWNALFFGQTLAAGVFANFTDTVGMLIPATPFQVTVGTSAGSLTTMQIPGGAGGAFVADLGVFNGTTGRPMTRVASAPATGQYSVTVGTGVYLFATADVGNTIYISYQYTATSTVAQKQTVQNLPMGYAPTCKFDLTVSYLGKLTTFSFPMAIPTKFALGFKNEDFAVPEFNLQAFDPGNGQVCTWGVSE